MHAVSHLELPGGIRMEIEQWGHGDRPLVLVHGYTGSRDDFSEQLDPLSRSGLTIALDLRGHGGTTRASDAYGYTFDALAGDLLAALDALEVARCDLLGHSMGGIVALLATLEAPERVASLVLMDTLAAPRALLPDALRASTHALVERGGMQALADALEGAARAGAAPQPAAMKAHIERVGPDRYWRRIRAKLRAMDPVAFTTLGDAFGSWPGVAARLGEIACPTTVIVGEEDAPFRAPAEALAAGIAGARLEVIPHAAHSPQLENAPAWLAAVTQHLARVRP